MACFFNSKSWYFHIHMICNFVFTIIISKKILTEHYHSEAVMSSWRFLCSNSVLLLPIVGQCWIVEWISQVVIFVLTTHSLTTTSWTPGVSCSGPCNKSCVIVIIITYHHLLCITRDFWCGKIISCQQNRSCA